MCTLLLAIDQHPDYRWIIAANRDEFRNRPTAPMGWWPDHPHILAGRDLQAGGTWMGVTRGGRFAAVTNFREARCAYPRSPSRGALVVDFLRGVTPPQDYLERIVVKHQRYDGFNLVVGDMRHGLHYYGNRGCDGPQSLGEPLKLTPGIYGLSNHRLDTPWPKVRRGKALFGTCLDQFGDPFGDQLETCIFNTLADTDQPEDGALPDTGVGLAWERMLAPLFINAAHYGTRSCSVVRLDHTDQWTIVERSIPQPGSTGHGPSDRRFRFQVDR